MVWYNSLFYYKNEKRKQVHSTWSFNFAPANMVFSGKNKIKHGKLKVFLVIFAMASLLSF